MTDINWPGAKTRKVFKDKDEVKREYAAFEREEFEKLLERRWYDLSKWTDECRIICSRSREAKEAENARIVAMEAVSDAENYLKGRIEGQARARAEEYLQRARRELEKAEEKLARAQPQALLEQLLREALGKAVASGRIREPDYTTFLRAQGSALLLAFIMKYPHLRDDLVKGILPERPGSIPTVVAGDAPQESGRTPNGLGQAGEMAPVSGGYRPTAATDEVDMVSAPKHPGDCVVDNRTATEVSERIAAALEDWADPKDEDGLRYEYVGFERPIRIALTGFDELLRWLRSARSEVASHIQILHDDLVEKAQLDDHLLETLFDSDVVHSEAAALELVDALRGIWSINEVPWTEPERTGAQAARGGKTRFTDTEENIVEALGNEHMTGPVLLKKAGYDYSSHYRQILSNLVKRGILGNDDTGYFQRDH
jgi:hypothetical protein